MTIKPTTIVKTVTTLILLADEGMVEAKVLPGYGGTARDSAAGVLSDDAGLIG